MHGDITGAAMIDTNTDCQRLYGIDQCLKGSPPTVGKMPENSVPP